MKSRPEYLKWPNLVIDVGFVALGICYAIEGSWWSIAYFAAAGLCFWWDCKVYLQSPAESEEPATADAVSAEAPVAVQYDDVFTKPVEPVSGDPLDVCDECDIEILKGLWRNEAHREERPDCRFCASLDKRAEAEGWERNTGPEDRGAL